MKDSFESVRDCLDHWEFCPLCGKRNNVEIMSHPESHVGGLDTVLTNSALQGLNMAGTPVFSICLSDNKFLFNMLKRIYVRLYCKGFHFSISYKLSCATDNTIALDVNKLLFFVKDVKTKLLYNVFSDYKSNQTSIQLSENSNTIQDLKTGLITFNNFNKKALVRRIRALSLLG